jgi:hypothetical protein
LLLSLRTKKEEIKNVSGGGKGDYRLDKFNDVGKRQAGFGRNIAYGFCG